MTAPTSLVPARPSRWKRLPVVHQVLSSVGLQRGMLIGGLVLTAIFVITAIFAPWIAPYGFAQLRQGDTLFGSQQPPSAEHWFGTTVGGLRRPVAVHLGRPPGHPGHGHGRPAVDLHRRRGRPAVRVLRRLGGPGARRDRRRRLRLPLPAARHRGRHRDQRRPVVDVGRRDGGGHLDHRRVHPAVLPGDPRRDRADQVRGVRGVRARHRGRAPPDHDAPRAAQLHAHPAADPHAQLLRGRAHPRRPGVPGLRHRADPGGRLGVRPQQVALRRDQRDLVDGPLPGPGDRALRARRDAGRRVAQRPRRPAPAHAPRGRAGGGRRSVP